MVLSDLLFQAEMVKQLRVVGTLNPDHDLLSTACFMMKLSHAIAFLAIPNIIKSIEIYWNRFDLGNSPLRPDHDAFGA
jgi:hypothetical protein